MSGQVTYLGTSVADWVGALKSSDPLLRRLGAYALGEIFQMQKAPMIRVALEEAARSPDENVAAAAKAALQKILP